MTCICQEAMGWLVKNCSAEAILNAMLHMPNIYQSLTRGGFKITPESISKPPLQLRIVSLFQKKENIVMCLVNEFGHNEQWKPLEPFFTFLGDDWMKKNWRALLEKSHDKALLAIVFAASTNPVLNRIGKRLLKCPSLWTETPQNNTKQAVNFWTPLARILESRKTTESDNTAKNTDKPKDNNPYSQQQYKELKAKLAASEKEKTNLQTELASLKKELKRKEFDHTEKIQNIQKNASEKQEELILNAHCEAIGLNQQWLKVAASVNDNAEELIQKTNFILEQQALMNKKHGTRAALRDQLNKITEAHQKAAEAAKESINIHPDLHKIITELENTKLKLAELLSEESIVESQYDTLTVQIEVLIKEVKIGYDTPAELAKISEFIQQASKMGLLNENDTSALSHRVETRKQLWRNSLNILNASKKPRVRNDVQEIWKIQNRLADLQDVVVIVDAYNAILTSEFWKTYAERRKLDAAATRKAFIAFCQKRKSFFKELKIVFDGDDPLLSTVDKAEDNIMVVFAQKIQLQHNADIYITDQFRSYANNSQKAWLVTDDYGLRYEVGSMADAVIPVRAFNAFIGAAKLL